MKQLPAIQPRHYKPERLVFFSDAVVAIAITLLALDLRVHVEGHLTFAVLKENWRSFAAFLLSFVNIAAFWRAHHASFSYIHRADDPLLGFNIVWLLFIVVLPFTTSLVSRYFFDLPAMLLYSGNIFLITLCARAMWNYARRKGHLTDELDEATSRNMLLLFWLDVINSLLAVVASFFSPMLAFLILITKFPMAVAAVLYPRDPGGPKAAS